MYDTLIYCSQSSSRLPTFKFHIKIPDKGSKNKLFAVTLKDSHTQVSYYVTTYTYRSSLMQNNTISLFVPEEVTSSAPATFFVMLACLGIVGFTFGLLYALITFRIIIVARFQPISDECAYSKTRRHMLLSAYCSFKLIYSTIFSLSVLILLLRVVCSSDLAIVNKFPAYHIEVKQLVERNIQAITAFKRTEMNRQNKMKTQRLAACSEYALDSVNVLKAYVHQYSAELKEMKDNLENKQYELLMKEIQGYLAASREHVDKVWCTVLQ